MADETEDEGQQEKKEQQKPGEEHTPPKAGAYNPHSIDGQNQPPLTDEQMIPVKDGAIPQNAEGITDGSFDPLNPIGNANIEFSEGNYKTLMGLPKLSADKTAQVVQTLVPLIEIALIELLGANNMYERKLGQCMPAFDNQGQLTIEFNFQYIVELWIGLDIELQAIQHDSEYILSRIQPCKANITKCEIDTTSGLLIIQGSL